MLPFRRTVLSRGAALYRKARLPGAFLFLLLWMCGAGCLGDTSPTPDSSPLPFDAKADSVSLPDASPGSDAGSGDATPAVDLANDEDAEVDIDGGAVAVDTRIVCQMPSYSGNCSEVAHFQCGFSATCEDGVLSISWHEHACDGSSFISSYRCTYTCPKGCSSNSIPWVSPGTQVVAQACNP